MIEFTDAEINSSLLTFARKRLGLSLYDWQIDAISPFDDASLELILVSLATPNGSGKAQPLDEPVLTPDGWRPIGELRPGDKVIAGDGEVCSVVAIHPQGVKEVFRVTFDDGAWTRCCGDHLWQVQSAWQRNPADRRWQGGWNVKPLRQVISEKRLWRYIPIVGEVNHPERDLPIDPYTMGVLLGDGCFQPASASLCTRHDTLALCKWPDYVTLNLDDERGPVSTWRITSEKDGRKALFLNVLRDLGLDDKRAWEKFVPEAYRFSSPEQRLGLLRGLMDTDGTIGKKKTKSPEFNTTSPQLAANVIELIRSLGGIATMTTRIPSYRHNGETRQGRLDHRVRFRLPQCPFNVERKAIRWGIAECYLPRRIMESATSEGMSECVCITIDHPSQLYVTRNHIVTHNSAIVIPTLVLGWLAVYPRGRVVLTTADGKQLDGQVMPAIESFRARFPAWKFIEREVTTPTGGRFVAFTTDQAGRAEGWHKGDDLDSPLLMIVDEAKTVPDEIFSAIDRCTFNALLLTSSPGKMAGRFYDSQFKPGGKFLRLRVGLKDCPHIGQDKIDRIIAEHGPDSPFTRSTLHGEFMEADGEARFDSAGLEALADMADVGHASAERVVIQQQEAHGSWTPPPTIGRDPNGWLWMIERPIPGCSYIGFCDPMTGEQSEGSLQRDTHAAGVVRKGYIDSNRVEHDAEMVAAIYVPSDEELSGAACRWDNDVLADRLAMLLRYYGNCTAIVESNNSGTEVIRLLLMEGCRLWRREKPNHRIPGKKMIDVVGFQTTAATKNYWIGALSTAIREQSLVCKFRPAVKQFATFVLDDKGRGAAQAGAHDDWCFIGAALYQISASTPYPLSRAVPLPAKGAGYGSYTQSAGDGRHTGNGACA